MIREGLIVDALQAINTETISHLKVSYQRLRELTFEAQKTLTYKNPLSMLYFLSLAFLRLFFAAPCPRFTRIKEGFFRFYRVRPLKYAIPSRIPQPGAAFS